MLWPWSPISGLIAVSAVQPSKQQRHRPAGPPAHHDQHRHEEQHDAAYREQQVAGERLPAERRRPAGARYPTGRRAPGSSPRRTRRCPRRRRCASARRRRSRGRRRSSSGRRTSSSAVTGPARERLPADGAGVAHRAPAFPSSGGAPSAACPTWQRMRRHPGPRRRTAGGPRGEPGRLRPLGRPVRRDGLAHDVRLDVHQARPSRGAPASAAGARVPVPRGAQHLGRVGGQGAVLGEIGVDDGGRGARRRAAWPRSAGQGRGRSLTTTRPGRGAAGRRPAPPSGSARYAARASEAIRRDGRSVAAGSRCPVSARASTAVVSIQGPGTRPPSVPRRTRRAPAACTRRAGASARRSTSSARRPASYRSPAAWRRCWRFAGRPSPSGRPVR